MYHEQKRAVEGTATLADQHYSQQGLRGLHAGVLGGGNALTGPRDRSEVEVQMERLCMALKRAHNAIDVLSNRLTPVALPTPEQTGMGANVAGGACSQLGQSIYAAACDAEGVAYRIERTIEQLAI